MVYLLFITVYSLITEETYNVFKAMFQKNSKTVIKNLALNNQYS